MNLAILLILISMIFTYQWFYAVYFSFKKKKEYSDFGEENFARPDILIVIPCYNAAENLRRLLSCLEKQDYPKNHAHVLVLADNCGDASAQVAREFRVEVYERHNLILMGKGYALDELLLNIKSRHFDLMVLFDVDARISPDYLTHAAKLISSKAEVFQGLAQSQNPDENSITIIENMIQAVIRVHQKARHYLNHSPYIIGSHGIVIKRSCLDKLGWRLTSVRTGDDLELNIRCILNDIPTALAPNLLVSHDVVGDFANVRRQRRRWTFSSLEIMPAYLFPLIKKIWFGSWRAFDLLFFQILSPSFSILVFLLVALILLDLLFLRIFWVAGWAMLLCMLQAFYYFQILKWEGQDVPFSSICRIPSYLLMRMVAFVESLRLLWWRGWSPTKHPAQGNSNVRS